MGSFDVDSPTTWVPYMNNQDCSQKICNLYCPQWCNYVALPSPPSPVGFSDNDASGASLSPLVIVIIGVFGSVCLLISYYVIISRLCIVNNDSSEPLRRRDVHSQQTMELEMVEDGYNIEDPLNFGPWHDPCKGLDEDMINSIKVCKYKKGDGLVSSTNCPVCLGEFQEDENLRLLPKCSHAFHLYCIDTWLTSHSNCPLCRANISCVNTISYDLSPLPPPPPPPMPPPPPPPPRPPPRLEVIVSRRVESDIAEGDAVIEITEEEGQRQVRRSVSMGYFYQTRIEMSDILFSNQQDEMELEEYQCRYGVGSSKHVLKQEQWRFGYDGESTKLNGNNVYLNCGDDNHGKMKRSFSSGRHLFMKGWKGNTLHRV